MNGQTLLDLFYEESNMSDELNLDWIDDFGFTGVDTTDVEQEAAEKAKQEAAAVSSEQIDALENKLDKSRKSVEHMYQAISKFLNNLKRQPHEEQIKWPNRIKDVEIAEQHFKKMYESGQ
jgi:Mn-dependent DtxR family transcriptional regulator